MKTVKTFDDFFVNESTSDYWPGYSDDGTSDALAQVRQRTYKHFNSVLRDMEKPVLNTSIEDAKQSFIQKWMFANMITTSLQDGEYIEPDLIDRAEELYKECLNKEEIYKHIEKGWQDMWIYQIEVVLKGLEELKKEQPTDNDHNYFYKPGFMEEEKKKSYNIK